MHALKLKGLAVCGLLALSSAAAQASPISISDLKTDGGSQIFTGLTGTYQETGAKEASLTDLTHQTSTAVLMFEYAGWANNNVFGIYNINNSNDKLQIFSGPDSPTTWNTVRFDKSTGYATTDTLSSAGTCDLASASCSLVGTTFGFYLTNKLGQTWYSDPTLNTSDGGADHMYAFNTSNATGSDTTAFMGSDAILAWDDQAANGQPAADRDFNDMIIGMNDVSLVPEPGTLSLLGLGILGMGMAFRNRKAG